MVRLEMRIDSCHIILIKEIGYLHIFYFNGI